MPKHHSKGLAGSQYIVGLAVGLCHFALVGHVQRCLAHLIRRVEVKLAQVLCELQEPGQHILVVVCLLLGLAAGHAGPRDVHILLQASP